MKSKLANAAEKVLSYLKGRSTVKWFYLDVDAWTEVAKHMGGKEMAIISSVSQWFNHLVSQDHLWKHAFLRDMKIPIDCHVNASWRKIYASAFDGSHTFSLHHRFWPEHTPIARKRLGAFFLSSNYVLLTHTLSLPSVLPPVLMENFGDIVEVCILDKARTGIWISDYHRVHGPWVWHNTTIGVLHILDARHCELFLEDQYKNGTWYYEEIAMGELHNVVTRGGIFNLADVSSPATSHTWAGIPTTDGVKLRNNSSGVAFSANLEENSGIMVKYDVMRDNNGEVVSIRIINFVVPPQ